MLKGALKPARGEHVHAYLYVCVCMLQISRLFVSDNVWSNGEVELLAELFKREVSAVCDGVHVWWYYSAPLCRL